MDRDIELRRGARADREALILSIAMALVGLIPVTFALVRGERFDAGETIGLMMIAAGTWGAVLELVRAARAP